MKIGFILMLLACRFYSCAQVPGDLIAKKCDLMFNGYNDVAPLYAGMDLKKFY